MDELFNSCPRLGLAALEDEILGGVLCNDNYLFYRTGQPDTGWPHADGQPGTVWELYCTACHLKTFQPKKRGFKPSKLMQCPECGATVQAMRWQRRRSLKTRVLFFKFQRGEGRQVWLRALRVTHDFCPEPGDEHLEFFEAARYLFDDKKARKWGRIRQYLGREILTEWREVKRVTGTKWLARPMHPESECQAYVGEISEQDLKGSCLEYSCLHDAIENCFDIPEYLDFYIRYPMIEYLWKFKLSPLLWEALMRGQRQELQVAVNLKAKRPKDLLRGLTVAEVREFAAGAQTLRLLLRYQWLKRDGVVYGSPACWQWTRAVDMFPEPSDRAARHGVSGKMLRSYIERQAKRSGHSVRDTLHDYGDYLSQIDELGGGELLPDNLQTAHARLSVRLRKLVGLERNQMFRVRRHLYSWLRWRKNGILIRPVDSVNEITLEGECQNNCVAGYADRHASGKTIICVMRRTSEPGKSWHTVELNPETLTVRQCRGYRNASAEPEAQAFADEWAARLQNIKFGRITA